MEYDFTQYRTVLGFQKSKRYLKWMKEHNPDKDLHHLLGSTMGGGNKKFTDYLVVAIPHAHHLNVVEPHKGLWFLKYLEESIMELQEYAYFQLNIPIGKIDELLPDFEPESNKAFIEAVYSKENK